MITATQRAKRKEGIGCSELGAIFGLSSWKTPYDIWLDKTGKIPDEAGMSEAALIGNLVEPTVFELFTHRTGLKVVKPTGTYKHVASQLFANVDGQVGKAQRGSPIVESKSTGLTDGWGEEGTDQVPDAVMLQVMGQMICSDAREVHVARLLGRFGFSFGLWRVDWDPTLVQVINDKVGDFWKLVERDTPPDDSWPTLATLERVTRQPGKIVDLGAHIETIEKFEAARQARMEAEKAEDAAKGLLLMALQDGDAGVAPGWSVKYGEVKTNRLNQTKLKEAHPEIVAQLTEPSSYRKLTVKAAKGDK